MGKTEEFLRNQFATYYKQNGASISKPPDFEKREFAFFWFDKGGALRHLAFSDIKELTQFIAEEGPAHIFHSAASYSVPDAPQMPLKEWESANLIFDIDADHIVLPCQKQHDLWFCTECEYRGKGRRPETCPNCSSSALREQKWMCNECLKAAKGEAIKVIENFLVPDFGISRDEIIVVFSGHRGYHIHCYTTEVQQLGSAERREIVDYIRGLGLDFQYHGFVDYSYGIPKGPDIRSPGWERKIAQSIRNIFQNPSQIREIPNLRSHQKDILIREASHILEKLTENPPRYIAPKKIGKIAWRAIAQFAVEQVHAMIDEPVTTDIHRLIRLPGSLHGKTGFLVKQLDLSSLESFDPFSDAQVFEGTTEVFVKESPAFRVGNTEFPSMCGVRMELPLSAAILLLCKGVATIAE